MPKKQNKSYNKPLEVKENVLFTDLIDLSLNTPPAKPAPKKKAKKKGR